MLHYTRTAPKIIIKCYGVINPNLDVRSGERHNTEYL